MERLQSITKKRRGLLLLVSITILVTAGLGLATRAGLITLPFIRPVLSEQLPNPDQVTARVIFTGNEIQFETSAITLPSHDHKFWQQSTWLHPVLNITRLTLVVPEDGWIIGSKMRLTDAPNRAVHHMVLHNRSLNDPYCGKNPPPVVVGRGYEGFFRVPTGGWSEDHYPKSYGYPVKKGDVLWFHIALHNPDNVSYPNAKVQVILDFVPHVGGTILKTARYLRMFVDPTCKTTFPLPPSSSHAAIEKTNSLKIPEAMRVLAVAAHMHENGLEFWFRAGKAAAHSFVPELNLDGTFHKYDFTMPVDFLLEKGTRIDFGVKYENLGAGYQEGGGTLYFIYTPLGE